jgi:hypothetical protein
MSGCHGPGLSSSGPGDIVKPRAVATRGALISHYLPGFDRGR